jgi:hypothetical protein
LKYLKFKIKGHEDALVDIIIQAQQSMTIEVVKQGVCNDTDACEKLYKLYPHWVFCNKKLYVYDFDTGMWTTCDSVITKILMKYKNDLYVCSKKGEISKTMSYGTSVTLMQKIPKVMRGLCINNDWLDEVENSSLGKLLFNNGYYDLKEGVFYKKGVNGFNHPKIAFFGKINYDYDEPSESDKKYMNEIKQKLFYTP